MVSTFSHCRTAVVASCLLSMTAGMPRAGTASDTPLLPEGVLPSMDSPCTLTWSGRTSSSPNHDLARDGAFLCPSLPSTCPLLYSASELRRTPGPAQTGRHNVTLSHHLQCDCMTISCSS